MTIDATDYTQVFAAKPQPMTLEQAACKTPPTQIVDTEGASDPQRPHGPGDHRLPGRFLGRAVPWGVDGQPYRGATHAED